VPASVLVRDLFHTGTNVTEHCFAKPPAEPYYDYLPDPCGKALGDRSSTIAARRGIEVYFDDFPYDGNPSTSMYRHTVTVYKTAEDASAYLSQVRAAVQKCPKRATAYGFDRYAVVRSTSELLDLTVRKVAPQAEPAPIDATFRVVVFRSGARVSVFTDVGWEGYPSEKPAVDALVAEAERLLRAWN
jgi:hypothetical protein